MKGERSFLQRFPDPAHHTRALATSIRKVAGAVAANARVALGGGKQQVEETVTLDDQVRHALDAAGAIFRAPTPRGDARARECVATAQSTFTIGTAKNRFAEPLFNPHLIGLYAGNQSEQVLKGGHLLTCHRPPVAAGAVIRSDFGLGEAVNQALQAVDVDKRSTFLENVMVTGEFSGSVGTAWRASRTRPQEPLAR